MPLHLHVDPIAGLAGDMFLGALVDLGADLAAIEKSIARAGMEGKFHLIVQPVLRHAIGAVNLHVQTETGAPAAKAAPATKHTHEHAHGHSHGHSHDHGHGHSHSHSHAPASPSGGAPASSAATGREHAHPHVGRGEILTIVEHLDIADRAKQRARRIVEVLAEAEALVHRKSPDEVHFHEVGAVDSIVDMLGAAIALELLGVDSLTCGPLPIGRGFVRCAHGRMPLPAPATAYLLRGLLTTGVDRTVETVTPTGAAIVAALAQPAPAPPPMKLRKVGYGAGDRDDADVPNVVRLFLGEC